MPIIAFTAICLVSTAPCRAADQPASPVAAAYRDDSFFKQMKDCLGRGINLGNALEAPHEGDWGVTLKAEYFSKIKAAGFQNVRIPVRWSAHAASEAPFTIEPKFFASRLACRQASNRLVPVLNMHHFDEIYKDPDANRGRFVARWQQIAEHYLVFRRN